MKARIASFELSMLPPPRHALFDSDNPWARKPESPRRRVTVVYEWDGWEVPREIRRLAAEVEGKCLDCDDPRYIDRAREIADRRTWGDTHNDPLAKAYYDAAVACIADALEGKDNG